MNRVIKFRAWNPQGDMLAPFEMGDGTTNEKLIYQEKFPLMQFTGLHDKNGKEIYEGDVIKIYGVSNHYVVGYDEKRVRFCFVYPDGMPERDIYPRAPREIIGNIYENPGLLQTPSTEE